MEKLLLCQQDHGAQHCPDEADGRENWHALQSLVSGIKLVASVTLQSTDVVQIKAWASTPAGGVAHAMELFLLIFNLLGIMPSLPAWLHACRL